MIAWVSTSASLWPAGPLVRELDAAEDQRAAATSRWESQPMPVRTLIGRSAPAAACGGRTPRSRRRRASSSSSSARVVLEAELLGRVGVAGQRDRVARVDDHLQERAVGVDLADRLAQPGGRDLDGDPDSAICSIARS